MTAITLRNGETRVTLRDVASVDLTPAQWAWCHHLPPVGQGGVHVGDLRLRQVRGGVQATIFDASETVPWDVWLDLIAVPA